MSRCLYMPPRSNSGLQMAFKRVKSWLLPTEKQKRKNRRERDYCRDVKTTSLIDVDGDIPPPPKEQRTRQNTSRCNYVIGTIANRSIKGRRESGARIEVEGGDQNKTTVDSSGHSELPKNPNIKRSLKSVGKRRVEISTDPRSNSWREPESKIVSAINGAYNDNEPGKAPFHSRILECNRTPICLSHGNWDRR